MQTVLSVILVIGILIFVHELGHLLMAKRSGILCREFAIGFGPKLFSFRHNETLYTIRLLPMGGYVRMAGEDPELTEIKTGHDVGLILNQSGQVEKIILNRINDYPEARLINVQRVDLEEELFIQGYDEDEQLQRFELDRQALMVQNHTGVQIAPKDRQFGSKSLGKRIATIFAGPFANVVLTVFLFFLIALIAGTPNTVIGELEPGAPAAESGLEPGDEILAIDNEPVNSWNELQSTVQANPEQEIVLQVERDGQPMEFPVVPEAYENEMVEDMYHGFIGVAPGHDQGFINAVQYGFTQSVNLVILLFEAIGTLVTGEVGIDEGLAGPIGIFDITGQAAQMGFLSLMNLMAFISMNLAILNLLPIPALDGGRLVFLGIEAIRGRPMEPEREGLIHFIGFALLMLLILVVTWNDIQRVFLNQ